MGQTLTNGIYLPDEGERNSYSGLEANWRTLDALILTINGKAAPNIANTWTAAQTFTAGIAGDLTGNVTGTASKAIADEDGTSIKTGYVNVAGNQTVTGDKSFTGSNTFNNILPNATNTYSLGTSTNKWKTINGYEPSALGEVYVGNEVTIDTTNWALDGSAWNTLDTSIMSGWVYFAVSDCDADSFILFRRGSNKAKNPTICFHPQHANSGTYYLYGLFMVPKNTACLIAIKTGTNGVLSQALLYPCFGNV